MSDKWNTIFESAVAALGKDTIYGFFGNGKLKRYVERNFLLTFSELKGLTKELEQCLEKPVRLSFNSDRIYEDAKSQLGIAKGKLASVDYMAFLEAEPIAREAENSANRARDEGYRECRLLGEKKLIT